MLTVVFVYASRLTIAGDSETVFCVRVSAAPSLPARTAGGHTPQLHTPRAWSLDLAVRVKL